MLQRLEGAEEMYWWEMEVLSQAIYRSSSLPYGKKEVSESQ